MPGEIVSVLFTDLVGSTELADRLGDVAAEQLRRTHFAVLREAVAARGGEEVKNLGDGLMVVFASAVDAVDAAIAIQRAVARDEQRLLVRVGVHVGEPMRADGDYFGTAVNLAKRLCDAAAGDQILVSTLVVDLVAPRGTVEFRPVGALALKGIARAVPAASVEWALPSGPTFRVLGPLAVEAAPEGLPTVQQRTLLACLLANPDQIVGIDRLIAAVWGERPPQDPRDALQSQVSRLRRRLGPDAPIATSAAGYRFTAPDRLDAACFERLLGNARLLVHDPMAALVALERALALWRGPAYADVAEHPELLVAAARLDGMRSEARTLRVELLLRLDRVPEALTDSQNLVLADPLAERPIALRMRALAADGRHAQALSVFDRFRRRLADELGLDPSPDLTDVQAEILRHDRARPGSPGTAGLPQPITRLVGRQALLDDIVSRLPSARLLTLTGPGGIGKTTLALAAGFRAADTFADGASLCELAEVSGEAVLAVVAEAVGIRQVGAAPLLDTLVDGLAQRSQLLLVDNCEHVLDAVAPLVERILARCPGVRVVATSRERLAVRGEQVLEVLPLELPAPDVDPELAWAQPAPAMQLLRERVLALAPAYDPDPASCAALRDVVRGLDGWPLALELAAARIATLGAPEVAGRLDRRFALLTQGGRTAPQRHRTLRGALEWSVDLLDPAERRAFEGAAVFVGGFTLRSAEAVWAAADQASSDEVPDLLAALVDKSLLRVDTGTADPRFSMLETPRELGRERLRTTGRLPGLAQAHARHYAQLALDEFQRITGPAEREAVRALDVEAGNLRAAFLTARQTGDQALAADLCVHRTWHAYPHMRADLMGWAEELLAEQPNLTGRRAEVLFLAARAAWSRNEVQRAWELAEQSQAAAAIPAERRWGLYMAGLTAHYEDPTAGLADLIRAAALARDCGDDYTAVVAGGSLAVGLGLVGDLDAALAAAELSGRHAALCGAPSALAYAEFIHGESRMDSDPGAAVRHLESAIELAASVGAHLIYGMALSGLSSLRARHGPVPAAAAALLNVLDHWRRCGNRRHQYVGLRYAVELLARAGGADAPALVMLAALHAIDGPNIYGADGERLARLRVALHGRLGPAAAGREAQGAALGPDEVVALAERELGALIAWSSSSAPA